MRVKKLAYAPPYQLTADILQKVSEISLALGRWQASNTQPLSPRLRRSQRIRTIQASLAIEANTLTVEQVTALMGGKRVLAPVKEVQEVRNAIATYELLPEWQVHREPDLLAAHRQLMLGLVDDAGRYRSGGVGIYRDGALLHMAPPASRVPKLMADLLSWLGRGEVHPLIASCVFHYEFEFIHPFADGNGRMGRLWQTLILSQWNPLLAWLPVETVVREQQAAYYQAIGDSTRQSSSTPFIEFMLRALLSTLHIAGNSDQVGDQVSDQVRQLLKALRGSESLKAAELMQRLKLKHRPSFRSRYLGPALTAGLIEMCAPDSPRSPLQRYRLSSIGAKLKP
ncbi:MAG: Fic family protein [Pseudomonadota bacterium]